jgi:hypothetical protein
MSGTVVGAVDKSPESPSSQTQARRAAAADLAKWYTSQSIIRRLWAIEEIDVIRIVVTLEPTPDGDDTHPAWLANSRAWAQELRLRLQRTVRLQVINEPSLHVESSCDEHSTLIAEVSWRDPSRAAD